LVGIPALQVFDESTPKCFVILEKKRKEDIWLKKRVELVNVVLVLSV
jgi:hypothetical protein